MSPERRFDAIIFNSSELLTEYSVDITENLRPLTTIERSYIQTFPKNFVFSGSKTDLEQVIGNAVPVKLGEFVANCINQYINDRGSNWLQSVGQLAFEYA